MGCGTSHGVYALDQRAYHGVAMALVVNSASPVSYDVTASAASHHRHTSEAHVDANRKANDSFSLGVNEALQRRMRRRRLAEWLSTDSGAVCKKQHGPAQRPRYDHLTKFGACQLGMVDELSTCAHVGDIVTASDGATRSVDHSLPSSLSTSGCTMFVNHASVRLEVSTPQSLPRGGEVALLDVSGGPHGSSSSSSAHPASPCANQSASVGWGTASARRTHPLQNYKLQPCNNGHAHRVRLVLLVPQRDVILSCSTVDRHMIAYHLQLRTEVGRLVGHDDAILGGAVSPDGRLVATASRDCTVILWELPSCQQRRSLPHPAAVHACRFSAPGGEVATACADGLCRVWTWSDTDVVRTLVSLATGFDGALTSLAYSLGDRHLVAGGRAGAVFVWDRQHLDEAGTVFRQHRSALLSVDASHTLQDIVASADERSVYLWNCQTLVVLCCIDVDQCCVPRRSPPAKTAASANVAATPQLHYWTAVRLVDTQVGVFVVAAASDKCVHLFEMSNAAAATVHALEALSLPFSSSVSCVDGGLSSRVVLGDTCGNRHVLTLM